MADLITSRSRHRRIQRRADHRSTGEPGDPIKAEQLLITLESDKASMEVPSPVDGVIKEIKIKVGDKVSEGTSSSRQKRRRRRPALSPRRG